MTIRDRFENLDRFKSMGDDNLDYFANPTGAIGYICGAVTMIASSIELAKRNGKPYDRLQVVLTALLETVTYLDEAQDEIDDLLNL